MLGVLAIAVLAAGTSASIPEFSEAALNGFGLLKVDSDERPAQFINPQTRIRLIEPTVLEDSIDFDAHIIPNQVPGTHAVCGNTNGININNGEDIFCQIRFLSLKVMRLPNDANAYVHFVLNFRSSHHPDSLLLDIPVYKIPREQASATNEQLKAWAREARVGLTSAVSYEQLQGALENQPIELDFQWLEEIVPYGLRDSVVDYEGVKFYVSRPVVLPEATIEKIVEVVDYLTVQENARNEVSPSAATGSQEATSRFKRRRSTRSGDESEDST